MKTPQQEKDSRIFTPNDRSEYEKPAIPLWLVFIGFVLILSVGLGVTSLLQLYVIEKHNKAMADTGAIIVYNRKWDKLPQSFTTDETHFTKHTILYLIMNIDTLHSEINYADIAEAQMDSLRDGRMERFNN